MVDKARLDAAKSVVGSWTRFSEVIGVSPETVNRYKSDKHISPQSIDLIDRGVARIEAGDLSVQPMRKFGAWSDASARKMAAGTAEETVPEEKVKRTYTKYTRKPKHETAVVPQLDGNVEVLTQEVMQLIRQEAASLRSQQTMSERFLRMALDIIELEKDAQASQAEVRAMNALIHRSR